MVLLQYFKRKAKQNDKTQWYSSLTKEETEKADEAILKALEAFKQSSAQGSLKGSIIATQESRELKLVNMQWRMGLPDL